MVNVETRLGGKVECVPESSRAHFQTCDIAEKLGEVSQELGHNGGVGLENRFEASEQNIDSDFTICDARGAGHFVEPWEKSGPGGLENFDFRDSGDDTGDSMSDDRTAPPSRSVICSSQRIGTVIVAYICSRATVSRILVLMTSRKF